jgi:hypothetical protein
LNGLTQHPINASKPKLNGRLIPKNLSIKERLALLRSDKLKRSMHRTLTKEEACFDFKVQFQSSEEEMPIEMPTVRWEEEKSPFQTVARIRIEKNSFTSEEFCENLSLSPWHGLVDHQPLGAINRARRKVYEQISKLRHSMNQVPRKEPDGTEKF